MRTHSFLQLSLIFCCMTYQSVILSQPANNLCANAIPISCGQTLNGTTVAATTTGAPTNCSTTTLNTSGGVWYRFTGNGSIVTASLCVSSYDTKIGVLSGSCGNFTCIASNDDGCTSPNSLGSSVTFQSVNNTQYYIYVTGFMAATGTFSLQLSCSAGDPCLTIPELTCGTPFLGNNIGGNSAFDNTSYTGCSGFITISPFSAPDRVFKIQKTSATGDLVVTLFSNNIDHDIFLFDVCPLGVVPQFGTSSSPPLLGCIGSSTRSINNGLNHEIIKRPNAAPGWYYIIVDGFNTAQQGNFELTVTCNDLICTNATPIFCNQPLLGQSNNSAANNVSLYCGASIPLNPGTGCTGRERVYSLTINQAQPVTINLTGVDANEDFDLFLLGGCNKNNCIASSTQGFGVNEQISTTLNPGTYYIIVEGWRQTVGTYNLSVSCCAAPIYNLNCGSTVYSYTGNQLQFSFSSGGQTLPQGYTWQVNQQNVSGATGASLSYNFPSAGNYTVCYPYLDNNGCVQYCCRSVCVAPPVNCSAGIAYGTNANQQLVFTLQNSSQYNNISWYWDDAPNTSIGATSMVSIPYPTPCAARTICVRYYDLSTDCWRICCRTIWLCNPFECEYFSYAYVPANGFQFTLNLTGATNISWTVDDTGQSLGTSSQSAILPVPTTGCISRTITVRYFWEGAWRLCCRTIWLCNPFECQYFSYSYVPASTGFQFTLNLTGATNILWTVDDTGQSLGTSSQSAILPVPTTGCISRTITVRYFWEGAWHLCCRTIWLCNPFECQYFSYSYVPASTGFQFTLNLTGATNILWTVDDTGQSLGTSSQSAILPVPTTGCISRTITVRYFWDGRWRLCCRTIWLCNPFECEYFSYAYVPVDTGFQFTLNLTGATNILWTVDDTGQSLGTSSQSAILPVPTTGCISRTVTVRYFRNGRWYLCCQTIWLCNPFECQYFSYGYVPASNGFQFTLNLTDATNILWTVDDTGQSLGTSSQSAILPIPSGGCISRTVTVRYFWEGAWRLCCQTIWLCNPFECRDFSYAYIPASNGFQFTLNLTDATDISWTVGETGQSLGTNVQSTVLPIPGICVVRTIMARYFRDGRWYLCYRSIWLCNPNNPCVCITIYDPVCVMLPDNSIVEFSNACFAECAGYTPDMFVPCDNTCLCPAIYDPVCVAVSGGAVITFPNACEAECAGYTPDMFVSCDSTCICPAIYDPVCIALSGGGFITFPNACAAECAGYSPGMFVPCEPYCICPNIYEPVCTIDNSGNTITFVNACYAACEGYGPGDIFPCNQSDICTGFFYAYVPVDTGFQFTLNLTGATNISWTVDDTGQSLGTSSQSAILPVPPAGCILRTITVRYFLNGYWYTCSRAIWLCNPFECDYFSYAYVPASTGFQFTLNLADATNISWTVDDTGQGLGTSSQSAILPVPPVGCISRTITVRYFWEGAWRLCCRTIWLCNPFECQYFSYAYVPASNGFQFALNLTGATNILWTVDDTGQSLGTSSQSAILPVPPGGCISRTITVRYFWDGHWHLCCRTVWLCNPFECGFITFNYLPNQGYQFTLAQGNYSNILWEVEQTNQNLGSNTVSQPLPVPVPGSCVERTICVRFFDITNNRWRLCCIRLWLCDPLLCSSNIIYFSGQDGALHLETNTAYQDVTWFNGNQPIGIGNTYTTQPYPYGSTQTIYVRYYDPVQARYEFCCRQITIPLCNLPTPGFAFTTAGAEVTFTNTTTGNASSYLWSFGNGNTSTAFTPPPQTYFTGTYQVCLMATNTCGTQQYCMEITVVNPADIVHFDIEDDVCGTQGQIVEVPIRVTNFNNVLSFQMSVRISNPAFGRFVEIISQNLPGSPSFDVVGIDSTGGRLFWFSGPPVTLPDNTIIAILRIQITGTNGASSSIQFSDVPIPVYLDRIINGNTVAIPPLLMDGSACILSTVQLCGRITREDDAGVGNVTVTLTGGTMQSTVTDEQGNYCFQNVNAGDSYVLTPQKDINYINGVNSGDLFRVQRHIFGEVLNSPYKIIAANTRNPNAINSGDLSETQRLILAIITDFPDMDSWRFIPKSFSFPNPQQPFSSVFPESISLNNILNDVSNLDFTGIKIGDVTLNNNPSNLHPNGEDVEFRNSSEVGISLTSTSAEEGAEFEISVKVADFEDMLAMQFSIAWDSEMIEFQEITNINNALNLQPDNFNELQAGQGKLAFVWFGSPRTLPDSTILFSIKFRATGTFDTNTEIIFSDMPTAPYYENTMGEINADTSNGIVHITFPCATTGLSVTVVGDHENGTALAMADGGNPPYMFIWSNGQTTQTATGLTPGDYSVSVTDVYGCTADGSVGIVSDNSEIASLRSLVISPNPTSGELVVDMQLSSMENVQINIIDASGKVLSTLKEVTSGKQFILHLEDKPSGLYLVKILIGDKYLTRRIVVIR
jgi:hypothetical protein